MVEASKVSVGPGSLKLLSIVPSRAIPPARGALAARVVEGSAELGGAGGGATGTNGNGGDGGASGRGGGGGGVHVNRNDGLGGPRSTSTGAPSVAISPGLADGWRWRHLRYRECGPWMCWRSGTDYGTSGGSGAGLRLRRGPFFLKNSALFCWERIAPAVVVMGERAVKAWILMARAATVAAVALEGAWWRNCREDYRCCRTVPLLATASVRRAASRAWEIPLASMAPGAREVGCMPTISDKHDAYRARQQCCPAPGA